ncbi:MAG TPA: DNA polymerase III subunit gamma/tau [Verrucomicrobiae bacterium]
MSYQVIARKYRPQRFSEVVGQEHVTQTLSNAINSNRIAHAYLFVGPRGTGKTTIARIFAKCLNCTGGPKADFPDDDPKANEITEGRSMDVLEIDGASNRGIEEIRELRETVKYAPAGSKYKIYIIDEVHMLTKEAFNALLKTLEEPPEHVKFMFATTEPEKVLPTILSRCQRFDLRRIPSGLIVKHLGEIAAKEGVQIDDAALYAIARGAEGGMRDAESTLDQLISFCGNKIQESDVLSMFGLAARAQLLALATNILSGDASAALRELNELARNGKDLSRLLSDLLGHFRNLMIFQFSKGDLALLDISEAEANTLAQQAQEISGDAITRIMEVLADAEGRLRDAASKKIFLEISLLKAIEARNAVSIDSVLKKLNEIRGNGGGAPSGPAPAAPRASAPTPQRSASPVAHQAAEKSFSPAAVSFIKAEAAVSTTPATSSAPVALATGSAAAVLDEPLPAALAEPDQNGSNELEGIWSQLVEAVGRVSPFMKTYLLESHPVAMNRSVFTIGFDPEFKDHLSLVDTAKNRTILETKIREMGHRDMSIRFVQSEAPAGRVRVAAPVESPPEVEFSAPSPRTNGSNGANGHAPAAASAQVAAPKFSKEDFKNDPLIKKALEIFKGTIVEVRA